MNHVTDIEAAQLILASAVLWFKNSIPWLCAVGFAYLLGTKVRQVDLEEQLRELKQ